MGEQELDVRGLPKPDKHPAIFAAYEHLPVGAAFVLVNNHDPKHLREEFEADYADSYGWEYLASGPRVWRIEISKLATTALPRVLVSTSSTTAPGEPELAGAVWRLQARDRDLDSNIIALRPSGVIETHTGPDLDVLIHVLSGSGQLGTERGSIDLQPGALVWLPRRSRRRFSAGAHGLRYLTVHQRRQALVLEAPPRRARDERSGAPAFSLRRPPSRSCRWRPVAPTRWQVIGCWRGWGNACCGPAAPSSPRALLTGAAVTDADVVELAPGLGRTAADIIAHRPGSYVGVEQDREAARAVGRIVGGHGPSRSPTPRAPDLSSGSADVVIGEAMLTMQKRHHQAGDRRRGGAAAAPWRALRHPRTRADPRHRARRHQGLHRPGVGPRDPGQRPPADRRRVATACSPATGCASTTVQTAPMALLQPRRLIADEGFVGALRFTANLLVRPDARRRVLGMRRTFRTHREHLAAVAIIAHKPGPTDHQTAAGQTR